MQYTYVFKHVPTLAYKIHIYLCVYVCVCVCICERMCACNTHLKLITCIHVSGCPASYNILQNPIFLSYPIKSYIYGPNPIKF